MVWKDNVNSDIGTITSFYLTSCRRLQRSRDREDTGGKEQAPRVAGANKHPVT